MPSLMVSVVTDQYPSASFIMSYFLTRSICTFCASGALSRNMTRLSGRICGYFADLTFVEEGKPSNVTDEKVFGSTGLKRNCVNLKRSFFHTLKSCPPGST